jgi:hypothetical protein
MNTNEITVEYSRTLSDGQYGSEKLGFTMTFTGLDPEYLAEDNYAVVAQSLRLAVLTELSKSAAPRVARAARDELNPPAPRHLEPVAAGPDDDEEGPF